MVDFTSLLSDSSRRTADIAVNHIGDNQELFDQLVEFALQDNGVFAMRAARVLNLTALRYPRLIRNHIRKLILKLGEVHNDGLKRGLAKTILEHSFDVDEKTVGILVDTCFRWLNDSNEKVALKVYGMEILYRVSGFYPEIKNELIPAIEIELAKESFAIHSRGKKLLSKLYEEIEK